MPQICKQVLRKGYLMSLGTVDENGVWVADVVYINQGFDIYWISDMSIRHSQAILKNPQVAATITLSNNAGEQDQGLQIEGMAKKLEGESKELLEKHLIKRGKDATRVKGILKEGRSWYKLTPQKIELIYEELFGWDKKVLEFQQ